ncbi:hypothetical protein [Prevotella sp. HUN102]|uniref:hypothetical protein n=1 Tax=Prevotella sp. HUN102 TaxID=1392486 RepID=UPI00048D3D21|nr:hypothetical protein [Prevotella sp. HUN102]
MLKLLVADVLLAALFYFFQPANAANGDEACLFSSLSVEQYFIIFIGLSLNLVVLFYHLHEHKKRKQ